MRTADPLGATVVVGDFFSTTTEAPLPVDAGDAVVHDTDTTTASAGKTINPRRIDEEGRMMLTEPTLWHLRSASSVGPPASPVRQRRERVREIETFVGEVVLVTGRFVLVRPTLDHTCSLESA